MINACPETGASPAWLPDGRLSPPSGAQATAPKVYVNLSEVEPHVKRCGRHGPVTNFAEAGNQDQPHIACGPTHSVVVWQENSGGWEIHVASSANDALLGIVQRRRTHQHFAFRLQPPPRGGHPRLQGSCHLENSGTGQVMYLRGTWKVLDWESAAESGASLNRSGPNQVRIEGALPGANYSVLSSAGAVLHRGTCDGQGAAVLPGHLAQSQVIMVQIQSNMELDLLRLGVATH